MATNTMLPMNPGGSNQTSAGVSSGANASMLPKTQPVFTPAAGPTGATNPYMATLPTSAGSTLYNPNVNAQTFAPGSQNQLTQKQFIDIAGKGVGGAMSSELAGLGGTASQIFQQWQAGQLPVQAGEQVQLNQQLAGAGVGANSSVNAIAQSNLEAQFNAQAAAENAQLMVQNQQTQTGILQGMQSAAEQEVASSGWDVFGQVMGGLGNLAGQVMGLPGSSIGGSMLKGLFGGGGGGGGNPTATNLGGALPTGVF